MSENNHDIREIRAGSVVIEVTDETTGQTFRRTFPIDYLETSSLVRLGGENHLGEPSEIVFYTSFGMRKMKDLTGGGIDYDPCGTHTE